MLRNCARIVAAAAAVVCVSSSANAITFTVDPAANWLGYMNVFTLPTPGNQVGDFVFGSPWGTADLCATFNSSTLTLSPNTIGDPNEFWYTPSGGPGSTGNKIMDANMYIEPAGSLPGQSVTFTGTVLSNTLTSSHTSVAFIKDFAPDFSSFNTITVPLTPGTFSITLDTVNDPARHVQYGFETIGACVWVTDVAPYGKVQIAPATPTLNGDFDNDGDRDAADIDALLRTTPGSVPPAISKFDVNGDNQVITAVGVAGSDSDHWVQTLKATKYGDTNLDLKVNFDDLLTVAQNYNLGSSPSWSVGNFNGDATINFDDLLLIAQNYGFGSLVDTDRLAAAGGSEFVSDWAMALSMTPEPASMALIAGAAMIGRRRR